PTFEFAIEGQRRAPSDPAVQAGLRLISPGYLAAAGIHLRTGRDFTAYDRAESQPVVMVNETMAHRYWSGVRPLGEMLRLHENNRWLVVVGVVPDIKHMGLKVDEGPVVYVPYAQKTEDWMAWATLVVQTSGEPLDFAAALRTTIHGVDKDQAISDVGTLA